MTVVISFIDECIKDLSSSACVRSGLDRSEVSIAVVVSVASWFFDVLCNDFLMGRGSGLGVPEEARWNRKILVDTQQRPCFQVHVVS